MKLWAWWLAVFIFLMHGCRWPLEDSAAALDDVAKVLETADSWGKAPRVFWGADFNATLDEPIGPRYELLEQRAAARGQALVVPGNWTHRWRRRPEWGSAPPDLGWLRRFGSVGRKRSSLSSCTNTGSFGSLLCLPSDP